MSNQYILLLQSALPILPSNQVISVPYPGLFFNSPFCTTTGSPFVQWTTESTSKLEPLQIQNSSNNGSPEIIQEHHSHEVMTVQNKVMQVSGRRRKSKTSPAKVVGKRCEDYCCLGQSVIITEEPETLIVEDEESVQSSEKSEENDDENDVQMELLMAELDEMFGPHVTPLSPEEPEPNTTYDKEHSSLADSEEGGSFFDVSDEEDQLDFSDDTCTGISDDTLNVNNNVNAKKDDGKYCNDHTVLIDVESGSELESSSPRPILNQDESHERFEPEPINFTQLLPMDPEEFNDTFPICNCIWYHETHRSYHCKGFAAAEEFSKLLFGE